MAFCDFVVKYDPLTDTSEELTKRILYAVIIKRLKYNKPAVMFIGGESGEGKSFTALRLQQLLLEIQGLSLDQYIHNINVYQPIEYPQKLDKLLYDKDLKKVNIICMHEAREVVKAKNWQSFLTQAVSDVNAMSRSIKRLCVMIISQFIRDITNDIRYTLNFYCVVRRPKGKHARLYINVLWKDDKDLEKPKLRKRKLQGYLLMPNGSRRRFMPEYLELKQPKKEIVEAFETADREAKTLIIRSKLNKLVSEMKQELGEESTKINSMVEFYTTHQESLQLIGKQYKKGWRLRPEVRSMHDLDPNEVKVFESKLNDKLEKLGFFKEKQEVLEDV